MRKREAMHDILTCKTIIYGAGYCGAMFAELLQERGIMPICFFDKNPAKAGMELMGIPVQQPHSRDTDSLVVVCMLKKGDLYEEIRQYLQSLGYEKILHIYQLREENWLFAGQNLIIVPNRVLVQDNLKKFANLRDHLSDELSRQVLDKTLEFLLTDVDAAFPAEGVREQYFAYDVYQRMEQESVVDCGAFKGEVMRIFLEKNENRFEQYFAIEPDTEYLPFLKKICQEEGNGKIEIRNCALSDRQERLRLRNYAQEDSVIKEDGEKEVLAFALDELMEGRNCTFLKIDVEGYDKKVVAGAEKLIREKKPVVAVAAYHHECDVWELYEMLHDLYPEYHFFLRSYMNIQETILYAVPPWRLVKENENEICR